jgi:nicotinamidase-related amidase
MIPLDATFPVVARPVELRGRVGLVVVDPCVGFVRRGAMSDPDRMIPMCRRIGAAYRALRDQLGADLHTCVFLDTHASDIPEPPYPPHCIEGTGEELIDEELAWLLDEPRVRVIRKNCINGFVGSIDRVTGQNVFADWVRSAGITTLVVTGDCTDICVSDFVVTALSARNHGLFTSADAADRPSYAAAVTGFQVVVLADACATYEAPGHSAAAAHHVGLWLMSMRGAVIASALAQPAG